MQEISIDELTRGKRVGELFHCFFGFLDFIIFRRPEGKKKSLLTLFFPSSSP